MHTEKWTNELDAITRQFTTEFAHLTAEQLNYKPDPQTWSIAQNLAHLQLINESYFPVLEALQQGTYRPVFLAKFGFLARWLGGMLLKSVLPDRKRKMKTFPVWEPGASQFQADVVGRFARHQEQLKQKIAASGPLLERGTIISSPANPNIVYPLWAAFDILVAHEARHLVQAREVLAGLQLGKGDFRPVQRSKMRE